MDGVLLSKETAKRHDQAANLVLSNRGAETTQARQEVFERRGIRFYRVPAGGVAAPSSSTTPTSATCTLMKWNAAGTALSATTITETVYFFDAAEADQIVKVGTIAGKNVAFDLASGSPQLCSIDWRVQFGSIATTTTSTVHELQFGGMPSTDTSVFGPNVMPIGMRLRKAGLYTIHCPIQVSETPGEVLRTFFNITDDASTVRTFSLYETHTIHSRLVIADPQDTNAWVNGYRVGEAFQESQHHTEVGPLSTAWEWTTCYDRTVYLPQSLIDQYGFVVLRNLISVSIPSGTGAIRPYRFANMPTTITYWGDYAETFGIYGDWSQWTVSIFPTGQGPALPGV